MMFLLLLGLLVPAVLSTPVVSNCSLSRAPCDEVYLSAQNQFHLANCEPPAVSLNKASLDILRSNSDLRQRLFSLLPFNSFVWVGAKSPMATSLTLCWGGDSMKPFYEVGKHLPAQSWPSTNNLVGILFTGGNLNATLLSNSGIHNGICETAVADMAAIINQQGISQYQCFSDKCYYLFTPQLGGTHYWYKYISQGCKPTGATTGGRLALATTETESKNIKTFLENKKTVITTAHLLNMIQCSNPYVFVSNNQNDTEFNDLWQGKLVNNGNAPSASDRQVNEDACLVMKADGSLEHKSCAQLLNNVCYYETKLETNLTQCSQTSCFTFWPLRGGVSIEASKARCITGGLVNSETAALNFGEVDKQLFPETFLNKSYATAIRKSPSGTRYFVWNDAASNGVLTNVSQTIIFGSENHHCLVKNSVGSYEVKDCQDKITNVMCTTGVTSSQQLANPAVTLEEAKDFCRNLGRTLLAKHDGTNPSGGSIAWVDAFEMQDWVWPNGNKVINAPYLNSTSSNTTYQFMKGLIYSSNVYATRDQCAAIVTNGTTGHWAVEAINCSMETSILCHFDSPRCSGYKPYERGYPVWSIENNVTTKTVTFNQYNNTCSLQQNSAFLFASQVYYECATDNTTYTGGTPLNIYSECRVDAFGPKWSDVINMEQCEYRVCNMHALLQPSLQDNTKYMQVYDYNGTARSMQAPLISENTTLRVACVPPGKLEISNQLLVPQPYTELSSVVQCNTSNTWLVSVAQQYNASYINVNHCPINQSKTMFECREIQCQVADFITFPAYINVTSVFNSSQFKLNTSVEFVCPRYNNITIIAEFFKAKCLHLNDTLNYMYELMHTNGTSLPSPLMVYNTSMDLVSSAQSLCLQHQRRACINETSKGSFQYYIGTSMGNADVSQFYPNSQYLPVGAINNYKCEIPYSNNRAVDGFAESGSAECRVNTQDNSSLQWVVPFNCSYRYCPYPTVMPTANVTRIKFPSVNISHVTNWQDIGANITWYPSGSLALYQCYVNKTEIQYHYCTDEGEWKTSIVNDTNNNTISIEFGGQFINCSLAPTCSANDFDGIPAINATSVFNESRIPLNEKMTFTCPFGVQFTAHAYQFKAKCKQINETRMYYYEMMFHNETVFSPALNLDAGNLTAFGIELQKICERYRTPACVNNTSSIMGYKQYLSGFDVAGFGSQYYPNSGYLPEGSAALFRCEYPHSSVRSISGMANQGRAECSNTTIKWVPTLFNCTYKFCAHPTTRTTANITKVKWPPVNMSDTTVWESFANYSLYPSGTLIKYQCYFNKTETQFYYCDNGGEWQSSQVDEVNNTISIEFGGGFINCSLPITCSATDFDSIPTINVTSSFNYSLVPIDAAVRFSCPHASVNYTVHAHEFKATCRQLNETRMYYYEMMFDNGTVIIPSLTTTNLTAFKIEILNICDKYRKPACVNNTQLIMGTNQFLTGFDVSGFGSQYYPGSGYLPDGSAALFQCMSPWSSVRSINGMTTQGRAQCANANLNWTTPTPFNCSYKFCPHPIVRATANITKLKWPALNSNMSTVFDSFANYSLYPSGTLIKYECYVNRSEVQFFFCDDNGSWQSTLFDEVNNTISVQFGNSFEFINCSLPVTCSAQDFSTIPTINVTSVFNESKIPLNQSLSFSCPFSTNYTVLAHMFKAKCYQVNQTRLYYYQMMYDNETSLTPSQQLHPTNLATFSSEVQQICEKHRQLACLNSTLQSMIGSNQYIVSYDASSYGSQYYPNSGYLPAGSTAKFQCNIPYSSVNTVAGMSNQGTVQCINSNLTWTAPFNCSYKFCPPVALMLHANATGMKVPGTPTWNPFANQPWYASGSIIRYECYVKNNNSQHYYCDNNGLWHPVTINETTSLIQVYEASVNCSEPTTPGNLSVSVARKYQKLLVHV